MVDQARTWPHVITPRWKLGNEVCWLRFGQWRQGDAATPCLHFPILGWSEGSDCAYFEPCRSRLQFPKAHTSSTEKALGASWENTSTQSTDPWPQSETDQLRARAGSAAQTNVNVCASAWALRRSQRGRAVGFSPLPAFVSRSTIGPSHGSPGQWGNQKEQFSLTVQLCNAVMHCRKTGRVHIHSAIGQGFRRNEPALPEPSHIGHVLPSPFETRHPGCCVPTKGWDCRRAGAFPRSLNKVGSAPGFGGHWTLDLACNQTRFARIMHRSEFGCTSGDYSSGRPWALRNSQIRCSR